MSQLPADLIRDAAAAQEMFGDDALESYAAARVVRLAVALDQYRAAVAARLRWHDRWERDRAGFIEEHLLLTGHRDPYRLLSAILEREQFWSRERRR